MMNQRNLRIEGKATKIIALIIIIIGEKTMNLPFPLWFFSFHVVCGGVIADTM